MLRDPVARYRSAVARLQRMAEERGDRVRLPSLGDATWRGFYFQQLRHVFEFFPREQVLVLQFERCVRDPVGGDGAHLAVRRGRAARPSRRSACLKHRQAGQRHAAARAEPRAASSRERYREDSARLAELCPEIDLSLWTERRGRGPHPGRAPATRRVS